MRAQVNLNRSSYLASLNISSNSYIPRPMPPVQRNRQDAPADVFNYIETFWALFNFVWVTGHEY